MASRALNSWPPKVTVCGKMVASKHNVVGHKALFCGIAGGEDHTQFRPIPSRPVVYQLSPLISNSKASSEGIPLDKA